MCARTSARLCVRGCVHAGVRSVCTCVRVSVLCVERKPRHHCKYLMDPPDPIPTVCQPGLSPSTPPCLPQCLPPAYCRACAGAQTGCEQAFVSCRYRESLSPAAAKRKPTHEPGSRNDLLTCLTNVPVCGHAHPVPPGLSGSCGYVLPHAAHTHTCVVQTHISLNTHLSTTHTHTNGHRTHTHTYIVHTVQQNMLIHTHKHCTQIQNTHAHNYRHAHKYCTDIHTDMQSTHMHTHSYCAFPRTFQTVSVSRINVRLLLCSHNIKNVAHVRSRLPRKHNSTALTVRRNWEEEQQMLLQIIHL